MRKPVVSVLCATAAVVLALGACSSSSNAPASQPSTQSASGASGGYVVPGTTQKLTITYPGYSTSAMLTYVAAKEGFFQQSGVDVSIKDGLGATANTLVLGGQADLVGAGPIGTALATAEKGRDTSIVSAEVGGGQGGYVVGNPKTAPTLAALQGLPHCTLNTYLVGSPVYGWTEKLKSKLGLKCEIVPYSDVPSELAAVIAGRADAAVASYSTLAKAISSNQVVTILDTRDKETSVKYYGPTTLEGVDWGVTSNLKAKPQAVTAYLHGIALAFAWVKSHTDSDVSDVLHTFAGFSTQAVDALVPQVAAARQYFFTGTPFGSITEQQWAEALTLVSQEGLPSFDPSAAINSYANRVDLTYLQAATK